MLTLEQVAQFKRDGYIKSGRVIDEEQADLLCAELERVVREQGDPNVPQPVSITSLTGATNPVWQILNIWQASDPFRQLMSNERITEEVAQLTGASTLRIWHDQIQYKPAETGGVNMWHQDAPLWPVLAPMTEVTAWVALDDVDTENGCMSMAPGSHLWGDHMAYLAQLKDFCDLPPTFEGHAVEVRTCPVKKGEVHYHHALVWHGSSANRSGRPRRAIALHYMTEQTRYVESGIHIMKPFIKVADGEVMQGPAFPLAWHASRE